MTVGFPKNVGRLWSVDVRLSAKVIIPRKRRMWRRFPQPRLDFSDRLGCTCITSNSSYSSWPSQTSYYAPARFTRPSSFSTSIATRNKITNPSIIATWRSKTTSRTTSASTCKTSHEQRYITHPFLTPTNQSPLHRYYSVMVWSQTSREEHRPPLIQRSS